MKEKLLKLYRILKDKVVRFFKYIWSECKDWRTVVVLALVILVVYSPVWAGYLLYFIFDSGWFLAAATAVAAFWAGPFTPFFPLCIAITLALKKLFRKIGFFPPAPEKGKSEEDRRSETSGSDGAETDPQHPHTPSGTGQ